MAVIQRRPLFQERANGWLDVVHRAVVGQCSVACGLPPVTRLGVANALVVQVGQRDHGRTAHAAHHNNLTDLAHYVVALKRVELATLRGFKDLDCEMEQVNQWLWARRTATKGLQRRSCGAHLAHVPFWDLAGVQVG